MWVKVPTNGPRPPKTGLGQPKQPYPVVLRHHHTPWVRVRAKVGVGVRVRANARLWPNP